MRPNDPGDVACITNRYFEINADTIYSEHIDLYDEGLSTESHTASRVIGRHIGEIVRGNENLIGRTLGILGKHIKESEASSFVRQMIGENCESTQEAVIRLFQIQHGIEEKV